MNDEELAVVFDLIYKLLVKHLSENEYLNSTDK